MRHPRTFLLLGLLTSLLLPLPGRAQQPAARPGTPPRPATRPAVPAPAAGAPKAPARPAPKPAAKAPGAAAPAPATPKTPAAPVKPAPRPAPAKPAGPPLPANLGSADPAVRYQNGKTLLAQQRNELAMQELEPLTRPQSRFGRAPEAAYLYAIAATRARKWAEAEQMLNLLRTEYSSWAGMPDAYYLQGQISFELNEPENALRTLAQVPAGQLTTERANLEAYYLPRLRDKATFQKLLQAYPQDAALGRAYADKLVGAGWYAEADKTQLELLISQFGLDRSRYTPRPRPAKKSSYNVAVLLPFEFSDPSWENVRKNQFVTDLYAGLRLAQDSLQREGRPLQLFSYDTGADTLQLKQLLTLPELAGMDLIIGPIYKSGSKLVARYAQQHQIACVNPLSQDGDLVLDNNWHYLFEPSAATRGRQAAQFAISQFTARTAVVVYEDTRDEAAFAEAYKATYEALGGKIQAMRRLNSDVDESLAAAFAGLDLKSAGHLVVASDARKAGPYVLQTLQTQGVQLPLITFASWLDNPRIDLGRLDARDVYFVYPHYLDKTLPGVRRFRQLYTQRQNLPPSVFAFTGFELLYYFGTQLHLNGPAFQQNLASSGPVSGSVFQGIGYPGGAHDNQYVPLTKLERLEVEVLNPVGIR